MNKIHIAPPPAELLYDGPAEQYISNGLEYFEYYKRFGEIKPSSYILDVGCGIGRKTLPLVNFIENGFYFGFDCNRTGVEWCKNNIGSVSPNFMFRYVDVVAPGYNPEGLIGQTEFEFPRIVDSYDLICANSVFTHMRYSSISHYLKEMKRFAHEHTKIFTTWFYIDKEAESRIEASDWTGGFKNLSAFGRYTNPGFYEEEVGYNKETVETLFERAGLRIKEIKQGTWSGNPNGLAYQDIIIAQI